MNPLLQCRIALINRDHKVGNSKYDQQRAIRLPVPGIAIYDERDWSLLTLLLAAFSTLNTLKFSHLGDWKEKKVIPDWEYTRINFSVCLSVPNGLQLIAFTEYAKLCAIVPLLFSD